MTEERKKKIKSEIIVWLLSIISIALLAFVISMRRAYINPVLAYHEDANTGNLVSDNLIDCENNAEASNDWQAKLLCYARIDNNTTYYYNAVYNKSGGNGNGGMAIYLTENQPPLTLNNWFPDTPSNATRIAINEDANATIHLNVNSGNYNYIAFYVGRTNDTSRKNFTNIKISLYNYNNTEYQPYGKIYYYSQRSYEMAGSFLYTNVDYLRVKVDGTSTWTRINHDDIPFNDTGIDFSTLYSTYGNKLTINMYFKNVLPISNDLRLQINYNLVNSANTADTYITVRCNVNTYISDMTYENQPDYCSKTYHTSSGVGITYKFDDYYPNMNNYGIVKYAKIVEQSENYVSLYGVTSLEYYNYIQIAPSNIFNMGIYVNDPINNNSYNQGYSAGITESKATINEKYQEGIETGRSIGYNEGFDVGSNENRSNTLVGLADTILSSPVNMFNTMFNFDFLGVNIAAFILSILTLLIVVWIIKRLW